MTYSRQEGKGEVPEEIYIVSYGDKHKIYSSLSAAKGVVTAERNQSYNRWNKNFKVPKIYIAKLDDLKEYDY